MITIDDFAKIELKVGTVLEAEDLEGSDKLLKLLVDLGEKKPRQVLAGIKQWYKPEDLIGKQVVVVANLEPRMMMGMESAGMILCVDPAGGEAKGKKPIPLKPSSKVAPGSKIR